jgi:hypothetical protein
MRSCRLALLSTVVLALGTAGTAQNVAPEPGLHELPRLIPEPLPAGGVAQAAASFYGPDDLYRYMDGAADIFVLYGVRTLLHQEFRAQEVDVTVDVFDMGSPDTAFGMYAAERAPHYRFVTIGAEGYQDEGVLNFLQDRYYVKLAGFGAGADGVLEAFARALSVRIGANPALPALLARLPFESRKPHSEQYMPTNPLGHSFLGPAYMVAYASGDQESKLLVTLARDEADARRRLKQLEEHFSKTGRCKAAPDVGQDAIRADNSFEGTVIAQTNGPFLVLLVNPASGGEELLRNAAGGLR